MKAGRTHGRGLRTQLLYLPPLHAYNEPTPARRLGSAAAGYRDNSGAKRHPNSVEDTVSSHLDKVFQRMQGRVGTYKRATRGPYTIWRFDSYLMDRQTVAPHPHLEKEIAGS